MATLLRRHKAARGATIVEFALALPVLILLILGIFEMGLLFKTYNQFTFAGQTAVRTLAISGTDTNADLGALNALQANLASVPLSSIDSIQIYDATNGDSSPVSSTYVYSPTSSGPPFGCTTFGAPPSPAPCAGGPWDPSMRAITSTQTDRIGIKINFTYKGVTGILPSFQYSVNAQEQMEPSAFPILPTPTP